MSSKRLIVALVGNPNAGKSTLFNALSGLRQHVGNYPGVTVEKKKGYFQVDETSVELIDLPGTYSLAARSPDEMVAVDLLLGRQPDEPRPDLILSIVDASNLDRHLYLTTQLMELGLPVVLAVNMLDVARNQGILIDLEKLSQISGLEVVPIQANKGIGLDQLVHTLIRSAHPLPVPPPLPREIEAEVESLRSSHANEIPAFLVRRALLDIGGHTEKWLLSTHGNGMQSSLLQSRQRLADAGHPVPAAEARARYAWIRQATKVAVTKPASRPVTWTDRLDRVLTHKLWGTLIFLFLMFLMFQSIFVWAKPLMELIDAGRSWLSDLVTAGLPVGPLRGLIADGVLKGVGGVLVFLPQIMILFGFIAFLEDCGYMARAAFLMDKLMARCGLSGKSFIPLLSSVACAVPGIMATRVIENRRDRLATILVAPLMSCSARLPVYLLFIGAFLKDGYPIWMPGIVLFGMYMLGFVVAPIVALMLKRTLLRGETPLFVMELPSFKRPSMHAILRRMIDSGWAFVYRAGTLILASMIVIWALLYFPHHDDKGMSFEGRIAALESRLESASEEEKKPIEEAVARVNGEWKRQSYLGRTGQFLEPVFRPLGWDWKIGMATMASFPAREVLVGTFGLIHDQGDIDDDDKRDSLGTTVKQEWSQDPIRSRYAIPVAVSVMVFFALCCQCASTLAIIWRETQSWLWPLFTFVYMTVLAYLGALLTFQLGRLLLDWVT